MLLIKRSVEKACPARSIQSVKTSSRWSTSSPRRKILTLTAPSARTLWQWARDNAPLVSLMQIICHVIRLLMFPLLAWLAARLHLKYAKKRNTRKAQLLHPFLRVENIAEAHLVLKRPPTLVSLSIYWALKKKKRHKCQKNHEIMPSGRLQMYYHRPLEAKETTSQAVRALGMNSSTKAKSQVTIENEEIRTYRSRLWTT